MFQVSALYQHPQDPAAFDRHYREVHSVLAAKIPGLTGYTVVRSQPGPDGSPPPYYLMAFLQAPSREAMDEAMGSPEAQAALADLSNFAQAGVDIVTGPVESLL